MKKEILFEFSKDPEKYADDLISLFEDDNLENELILKLANILANSGDKINKSIGIPSADVPSTGGPSSLSTLLCPLFLVASGAHVLKLGVPGRPAGGIDVLSQINGYRINFTKLETEQLIKKTSYIHILAQKNFAPLDGWLFSYRKRHQKINVPNLAIASLLSKKICMGVNIVGLDVRVSEFGNFGKNFVESSKYSKKFVDLATMANIKANCFLSDSSQPYQPYIGRGEALLALYKIFNNDIDPWLEQHLVYCKSIVEILMNKKLSLELLKDIFIDNLHAQGTDYHSFEIQIKKTLEQKHFDICSSTTGYLYYDLNFIRSLIVNYNSLDQSNQNQYPDKIGVTLYQKPGTYVESRSLIASIRIDSKMSVKKIETEKLYTIEKTRRYKICGNEVIV